jgi:hypothetical protein
VGVQAELDGAVIAPLPDLVVHPPELDVAAQRRVLEAEHPRRAAVEDPVLVPHPRHAHAGTNAEQPVQAQLEQHVAAEQRR